MQQGIQRQQVSLPEYILPRYDAQQINHSPLRMLLHRSKTGRISQETLHHRFIALVHVAFKARRRYLQHRIALLPRLFGHGRNIVADQFGRAAGQHDISVGFYRFYRILYLFPQPGSAAKHDLLFPHIGGRQRRPLSLITALLSQSQFFLTAAAGRGMNNGQKPLYRPDSLDGAQQRAVVAAAFYAKPIYFTSSLICQLAFF